MLVHNTLYLQDGTGTLVALDARSGALRWRSLSSGFMTVADIATVTPELEAACRKLIEGVQTDGAYMPPGYNRLSLRFPGNHGGLNWSGTSFNPQLGYLFVNTNELGQLSGLKDRPAGATGPPVPNGVGNRLHPDAPYDSVTGGGRFSIRVGNDPQQLPCSRPRAGRLRGRARP